MLSGGFPEFSKEDSMYESPRLVRFGTVNELTQAGCYGATDNFTMVGIGTSVGSTPRVTPETTDICLVMS
jgi:hypothetical protein